MFGTVRTRILFFAFLSVFAVAGLSALSWSIILKAEDASKTLIQTNLNEAWLLADLEQDHRHLQDLAYKIKAQLLLWDEIETEFSRLETALPAHWQKLETDPGLSEWAEAHRKDFERVQALIGRMKEGIAEKSYYRVGQVVDFDLFPAMEPMLQAIAGRQFQSRRSVSQGADELLSFLADQQHFLIAGSVSFLLIVIAMTWWLRQSVILRLQSMENDLVAMEKNADLTRVPVLKGQDEVAGVAKASVAWSPGSSILLRISDRLPAVWMDVPAPWITVQNHSSQHPRKPESRSMMSASPWPPLPTRPLPLSAPQRSLPTP